MHRCLALLASLLFLASRLIAAAEPGHDFARWEKEVAAYEAQEAANPPPKGGIVFTGASSIRRWSTLTQDFTGLPVINHGFGGTQIVDATHFAERLIFRYEPRIVCLRAGGNDIHAGKTPEQAFADFQEFVSVVHARLPAAKILFLSLSPSIAREPESEAYRKLNELIAGFAAHTPFVRYVDTWSVPLDPAGRTRADLFLEDKQHFNAEGYRLFAERIRAPLLATAIEVGLPLPAPRDLILAGRRVLVLGDSITQDGRYVSFLEYYLHRLAPAAKPDIISIGLSSETVSGLSEKSSPFPRPCVLERLDRALKATQPQLVLACYGMNDGIYHPPSSERLAAFNAGLDQLIAKVRAAGAQLVLITPPVFDPVPIATKVVPDNSPDFGYSHFYSHYDDVLAEFARAEFGRQAPGLGVIDLHTQMAQTLAAHRQHDATFSFTRDGVHPGEPGHLLIARIIAAGLGFELPAGNPDEELARIQADPVFALVSERRELRSEAWLPFVGYSRDGTMKSGSVKAVERTATRLEQQIEASSRP